MKLLQTWGHIAAVAVLLSITATTHADSTWTNTAGGTFSTAGNWDPNAVPGSTDIAAFGQTGSYTVDFTGTATTLQLLFTNSNTVTFDMRGQTYTASATTVNPGIIISNTAKLILSDSVNTNGLLRNHNPASNRPITVRGNGLEMNTSLGFGTTFLVHGDFNAFAPVLVNGVGSFLNHDQSFFNLTTGGSLTITNGGRVNGANFQQINSGAPIIIDGNGSLLKTTANSARVAQFGGNVTIKNGGTWDTSGLQYEMAVSSGTALIDVGNGVDTSSIIAGSFFFVGFDNDHRGNSEIRVHSGGLIRATTATDSIRVTDDDTLTLDSGVIEVASSGMLKIQDLLGSGKGLLRGEGTIQRVSGGTTNFNITNDGNIRPGDTNATPRVGTMHVINGNLTNTSRGTMFFDLIGGGHGDFIDITGGVASLGGTNLFSFGGYTPQYGDQWELFRADTISTNFAHNLTALLTPFGFQSIYQLSIRPDGDQQALFLTIPEPSTVALLALGGLMFLRSRRRE